MPKRLTACATASGGWRGCSSGWVSRIRRHDHGIRRAARPRRPRSKKGLGSKLAAIAALHPQAVIQLWCEDEARVGQKGRICHRWYERGVRPPGTADQRYDSLYLFAACRPGTDEAFALALDRKSTRLNSSHANISYAVFCLKKKNNWY